MDEEIPGAKSKEAMNIKKGLPSKPVAKEQHPEDFEFEGRSSMVIGETVKQPGGDEQLMAFDEHEDLTANIDNLADHFDGLDINDNFSKMQDQVQKSGGVKRKLTVEEESELRST